MERTDEARVNELEIKTNWLRKPSQTPGQGPLTTVLTRSPQWARRSTGMVTRKKKKHPQQNQKTIQPRVAPK